MVSLETSIAVEMNIAGRTAVHSFVYSATQPDGARYPCFWHQAQALFLEANVTPSCCSRLPGFTRTTPKGVLTVFIFASLSSLVLADHFDCLCLLEKLKISCLAKVSLKKNCLLVSATCPFEATNALQIETLIRNQKMYFQYFLLWRPAA